MVKKNNKGAKNKDKRNMIIKISLMLGTLFLIAGVVLFYYGKLTKPKDAPTNVSKVENSIEKYNYTINDNASIYYKEEFEILKEMAEQDTTQEEDIVKQVAKLYIIDLNSLNEKINKYEVTSSQYYYSDKRTMHTNKVIDNYYNLMKDNSYNDRKQELPSVSKVEINDCTNTKYDMNEKKIDAYEVTATIDYVKEMGYDNKVVVTLVKDGNNFSVVSYQNVKTVQ